MNKPLYRIWDIEKKQYLKIENGFQVDLNGDVGNFSVFSSVFSSNKKHSQEDYIIQRCTGEQDVNGKYIYEGDIVESYPNVVSSIQAVVNFNTGNFVIEDLQGYEELTFEDALTVIGNNLENPELLLEKEEE